MTQAQSPKVVNKKLFSPIWLLPLVALALAGWLGIKSLQESGIKIEIHFPSASGIDVGKTLVRYQGLNIGKVVDIGLDSKLDGVDVTVLMDYRAEPFLKANTKFWLVTPKASITGVEGLDALFSGNYIAVQPGNGEPQNQFIAQQEAPPIQPGKDGTVVELYTKQLGSVDVGSQIFYQQIPVGKVVSYRLEADQRIQISAFISEKYAYLVKTNSRFWNVSGISVDASIQGIKVKSESLSTILAGGIAFSSDPDAQEAEHNASFTLYQSEEQASGGIDFHLITDDGNRVNQGTPIQFRGIQIGEIIRKKLSPTGVILDARLFDEYAQLLSGSNKFYLQGAQISLDGIKHPSRLITGDVIEMLPGTGAAKHTYLLLASIPNKNQKVTVKAFGKTNPSIQIDAAIKYKDFDIGKVVAVSLATDFSGVNYRIEIPAKYQALLTSDSYFYGQSALNMDASFDGVKLKTNDANTLLKGALVLVTGSNSYQANSRLMVYDSEQAAKSALQEQKTQIITLSSTDGAGLSAGSPVYYKKMQIGKVKSINWQGADKDFKLTLAIDKAFKSLLTDRTVFWQNSLMEIDASLAGVSMKLAPLEGAIKGSISLGLLPKGNKANSHILYNNEKLALAQAQAITLNFPTSAGIKSGAAIRYQGYQIGEIQQVALAQNLNKIQAKGWLYGAYADKFLRKNSQYILITAQFSLTSIKAPETLITGPYVSAIPGTNKATATNFKVKLQPEFYTAADKDSLKITLTHNSLGSIKSGTPVFFRGIKIGAVKGFELDSKGNQVKLYAAIEGKYRHLINKSSKFWDYSGIKVDLKLFTGARIESDSLETILTGGIAVATEFPNNKHNHLEQHASLPLLDRAEESWSQWAPILN